LVGVYKLKETSVVPMKNTHQSTDKVCSHPTKGEQKGGKRKRAAAWEETALKKPGKAAAMGKIPLRGKH